MKRQLVKLLIVFLLYFISAILSLKYAVIGQTVTLLWPPSGIALAVILRTGFSVWPGIALGAFAANIWNNYLPLASVCLITAGDTLEPVLGAILLGTQQRFSLALDKPSDVLQLLTLAACGSTMVGATFGTLGLNIAEPKDLTEFFSTWLTWWIGNGMGVLVISPLFLTAFSLRHSLSFKPFALPTIEFFLLLSTVILIGQTIFGSKELAGLGYFEISLSIFPFAIWSALRFGPIGASNTVLIVSLLAVHGTTNGTGPFVSESKINSLVLWCLFTDLIAITGLILAAVNCERKKALTALKVTNETLDKQVKVRTNELIKANLELHSTLAERQRLQIEMNQISESRQKMIGQELHDGLGQQLTGVAFLISSVGDSLKAGNFPEVDIIENIKHLIDEALTNLRALSRGLYPTTMETDGLAAALKHLAEYSQSSSGIQCSAQCETHNVDINETIALNLYRIAQEAISNALRHSKAQRIEIKLIVTDIDYKLRINDDGIGFQGHPSPLTSSLGFRSMQSRANLIGARIQICKNSQGGMSIIVSGPNQYFGE